MKRVLLAFLLCVLLAGCNNNQTNSSSEISVSEPVTWIKVKEKKYYYFSSNQSVEEGSLVKTEMKTDTDDAVEVGQDIYRSSELKDSFFIKNKEDGSWLEYRYRE